METQSAKWEPNFWGAHLNEQLPRNTAEAVAAWDEFVAPEDVANAVIAEAAEAVARAVMLGAMDEPEPEAPLAPDALNAEDVAGFSYVWEVVADLEDEPEQAPLDERPTDASSKGTGKAKNNDGGWKGKGERVTPY
jgi:hypothetical protein